MKEIFELDNAVFSKIMALKRGFISGEIPEESYKWILIGLLETLEHMGIEVEGYGEK